MLEILKDGLHKYLSEHRSDVIITSQQKGTYESYLDGKIAGVECYLEELVQEGRPASVIKELCMKVLTEEYENSKYDYLKMVLEEDFNVEYLLFQEFGILTYEIINMVSFCEQVFEEFGFNQDSESDRMLRYAAIERLENYLRKN